MEKRVWAKPEMQEFAFAANEYCVSSCDDKQNNFWKFICNFGGGKKYDIYKGKYDPSEKPWENYDKLLTKDSLIIGKNWYEECGKTHYVKQKKGETWEDYFEVGWADDNAWDGIIGNVTENVYIWTDGGTDVHVTTQLGEQIEIVEGNKS